MGNSCLRCHGLLIDEYGDVRCVNCGYHRPEPVVRPAIALNDRIPLVEMNALWRKTKVGSLACTSCHGRWSLRKWLCRAGSETLWCPFCKAEWCDPSQYKRPKVAA